MALAKSKSGYHGVMQRFSLVAGQDSEALVRCWVAPIANP